jgi:hypothetical protein
MKNRELIDLLKEKNNIPDDASDKDILKAFIELVESGEYDPERTHVAYDNLLEEFIATECLDDPL